MEPRQIGWSQESNLLWQISKTLEFIQGNVGGLQGTITLTTTGNSGPATFTGGVLNIPEYTIEGLGGVPNTRTISINGDTQSLANDVAFTVLGQAISVVPNYSALPAPATVSGAFYWVEFSQGAYWLPGNLGGTFYNAGMYYSNGVAWQFMESPFQAVQAEVDAGVNFTKFVTPLTFEAAAKWSTKQGTLTLTVNGTSGPASLIGNVLNIPQYSGGGAGTTDLGYIPSAIDGQVTSSTGAAATIPLVTDTFAGLLSPGAFIKLNNLGIFTQTADGLVPATVTPPTGRVLSDNGTWITVSGGGGATNLTYTSNINTGTVNSDTGTDATIPAANGTVAGLLTTALYATYNAKQGPITLTTTGTSGAATFNGTTLNIPNYDTGGGGATTLDELTDVEIVSPTDTQVLTYELSTGLWKNKDASGGGGGSAVVQVTIVVSTPSTISTATVPTDFPLESQHGKNVIIDNGANAVTIQCLGGVTATYCRHIAGGIGTPGIITFQQGAGRILVPVDGTLIFSGLAGSTASLWSVGTIDYLRISNA